MTREQMETQLLRQAQTIGRMREALEFYANPGGKCEQIPDFYSELDFGSTAEVALAFSPIQHKGE